MPSFFGTVSVRQILDTPMLPLVEKERASALYEHLNVRWRALQSTLTLQRDSGTCQLCIATRM